MDNQLISLIEKIVEKKLKEMQPMTREPAVVLSSDSENGTATVRFLSGSKYELLNKTGEVLYEGDSIWVDYRTLPSEGYIAMRNGKAVGLYKEADENIEANAVRKFRTSVESVYRKEFNAAVGPSLDGFVISLGKLPVFAPGSKSIILHISHADPSMPLVDPTDISHFELSYRSMFYTKPLVWIGNEAYVQFPVHSFTEVTNAQMWIHFDTSASGPKSFFFDLYCIPSLRETVVVDMETEGMGSIGYSEFVRYVQEEITSAKQRLDTLEVQ